MTPERATHETATPEQVSDARQRARAKLAAAAERCTPEFWVRIRAKYGITTDPAR